MIQRAERFQDLNAYKVAFELQQEIYKVTKRFPKEERYSLTDQIRRSSRSIGANISEAWKKRRYAAHFISKLSDADGELAETEHWIGTSLACGYISKEEQTTLLSQTQKIGMMLGKMISTASQWSPRPR